MRNIQNQLKSWTIVGPFFAPRGKDMWFESSIDGAKTVPASFRIGGEDIAARTVRLGNNELDFERLLAVEMDRSSTGVRHQAVAFCEVDAPCDGTLEIVFDADWRSVWWVNGEEVYATRQGNAGKVGQVRHRFKVVLRKGKNVLCVRVIPSNARWRVVFWKTEWRRGVDDDLIAGRRARWRDYSRSAVRLEHRPLPDGTCGILSKENFERFMAERGVDGRWISVVHHHYGSYYRSKHLPLWEGALPEHEKQIAEWVDVMHENRMSVLSWYALTLNKAAWDAHKDWRQVYLYARQGMDTARPTCCTNSPYGEALIDYVIEAIGKFDLDGFWFDGSAFSPIWGRPVPVSCVCRHCRRAFREATDMDLPETYDWSLPGFRRWVSWRYDMFGDYWTRLTDRVHEIFPDATIVYNHYHRELIGMPGAVPLNPFGSGFISGTEADGEPMRGAFYTKLMRAYGRGATEVWIHNQVAHKAVDHGKRIVRNSRQVMDFVLACTTAGGNASVGGADYETEGRVMGMIAEELKPRQPFVNLPSISQIAMLVSQQTETFVFGRDPSKLGDSPKDYYWNSLVGWHHVLAYGGLTCDVLFDDHLKKGKLTPYPVLLVPFGTALAARQYGTIMNYVRNGGVLITGPWFGLVDRFGERKKGFPVSDQNLFPMGREFPCWEEIEARPDIGFRAKGFPEFPSRPLSCLDGGHVSLNMNAANRCVSFRKYGKGRIVQTAFDIGTLFRNSENRAVIPAVRRMTGSLAGFEPLAELVDGEGAIMGLYRNQAGGTVVHVQQVQLPWGGDDITVETPPMRWGSRLVWRGNKPRSARCMLPDESPDLPIGKSGKSWLIDLPPFCRGQVVVVGGGR